MLDVARRSKRLGVTFVPSFEKPLALVLALLAMAPLRAFAEAQDSNAPPDSPKERAGDEMDEDDEGDEDEDELLDSEKAGVAKASAPDDRTLHAYVNAHVSSVFAWGSVARDLPMSALASAGLGFGGHLGLGLSRALVLEAGGTYAMLGAQENCADCKAGSFDLGLGFSYHVAQGFALDPWVGYGIGVRWMNFPNAAFSTPAFHDTFGDSSVQGLDLARLSMGGDFYPLPALGIGLFLEADIGRTVSHPFPELLPSTYAFFQIGARLSFDPSSKSSRKASPSSKK